MRKGYFSAIAAVVLASSLTVPTNEEVREDLDAVRDPKEGGARCPKCGRQFKTDTGMAMHLSTYHQVRIGFDLGRVDEGGAD
ncbi:hypothetical protein [Magnetovibrio sp.]|uniref:hypothetical protein n=1 Tax=Magnetovibrio sp. TaxID=2024836 RepID=UPI002F92C50A